MYTSIVFAIITSLIIVETESTKTSLSHSLMRRSPARKCLFFPSDCQDIQWSGFRKSDVYTIYPEGTGGFKVFCDLKTNGGGWTVLQRRFNGLQNFNMKWHDYKYGFGNITEEYWIGNQRIHQLLAQGWYEVRFDLADFTGHKRYAEYKLFKVGNADSGYKLTIGEYSGNAGDDMKFHSGSTFHTMDRDKNNCSSRFKGGFWYYSCHRVNINGLYHGGAHESFATGMNWYAWHGYHYSLKTTEMKIRRL